MGAAYKPANHSLITWAATAQVPQNTTRYFTTGILSGLDLNARIPVGHAGVISNLFVETNPAPGGVQTYIFTLYVNGAPTALTCTITGAQTVANDIINAVAVVPGDTISMEVVSSATAANNANVKAGMGFHG